MRMFRSARRLLLAGATCLLVSAFFASNAKAGENSSTGHISNVTFAGDYAMVMLDSGLPDNCVGTAWGWMKIPASNKPMLGFVLGLWMRGDAGDTLVSVYTDGLVDGYCRVTQIDPES